jgi:MSHA biogenesis protein MshP
MTAVPLHVPRFLGRARGVGLVTAIFLLVVLSGLAVAIAGLFTTQQATASLDELGARAYQAARTGIEWGVYQQLHNSQCAAATTFAMPASATSLSGFSVTVTCSTTGTGALQRWTIIAVACNKAGTGSCPNRSNNPDYVERKLEVVL